MNNVNTLSEFLLEAGTQFRIFDMGRRVQKISHQQFFEFEQATTPYPYPIQQHALLAVLFWNKTENDNHYVWFLKLPLDEKGLLIQGARNQFLELVINALGSDLEQKPDKEQQSALDNNPLIFKPSEQKLAAFTSQSRLAMQLPPSQFMSDALNFINDQNNFEQWQHIGFQGLADIATRIEQNNNLTQVCHAIKQLPVQPFCALCCCLENIEIETKLAQALLETLTLALQENNQVVAIHALRALSHSKGRGFQEQALTLALANDMVNSHIDFAVIIAGRYWEVLDSTTTAVKFLELVVNVSNEQDIFNQLFGDLVAIPITRTHFLNALRHPERSNALANAIAKLIGG